MKYFTCSYLDHKYMEHGTGIDDWSLELGYQTAKKDTFPRRAMSAGSSAGLFLELKAYGPDLDYICKGPVQGFKVYDGNNFLLNLSTE